MVINMSKEVFESSIAKLSWTDWGKPRSTSVTIHGNGVPHENKCESLPLHQTAKRVV